MWAVDTRTEDGRRSLLAKVQEKTKYILKKEPLGVWVDEEMDAKVKQMMAEGEGQAHEKHNYRDHFLMPKINAALTEKPVSFVRNHEVVLESPGIQEIGLYGTWLSKDSGDGAEVV